MFGENLLLAAGVGGRYGDMLRKLFPNANVTSGYRGSDHPLTRRNPSSPHAHGSTDEPGALDVAPIPGMTFDDFVSRAKSGGLPVSGALDEQAHPKPWTTGPNWHLSLLGAPQQVPQPKRTLADLARPDLNQMAPVNLATGPLGGGGATLGSLLQTMPQGDVPDHKGLFPGKDWKTILPLVLGSLADGLSGLSGQQGVFAPMMARRQDREAEERQARERLAAQIEQQRMRAQEPPQFVQNLQAWMQLPEPLKRQYIEYQDITNPIAVSTPQGTQRVPRQMGGNTQVIDGVTYYNINGEWYDNPEGR